MPTIQNELESQVGSYVDDALQNAVSEAAVKVLEGCSEATQEHRVLNGHVDLSQDPVMEAQNCQSTPEDVVLVGKEIKITDQSEGYDIVPSKDNNVQTELTRQKSGDFWRRSLISDLEGDEFDEVVESEKSLPSARDSTSPLNDEELTSDEDAEFIDSSEDEVIDHGEDAKLGAVGGSNMAKYRSNYDDFDNADEEDDDDTDDDGNEELFVSQSAVDGLCASKHTKDRKRKKKRKTLPRARIQSAGSHYNNAVVIDNGCGTIKLGMAGEKKPSIVQPALYGVPKRYSLQMAGLDNKKDRQFGDAAAKKAGVMQLEYPMKAGLIENWSDIEDIWEYMLYSELGIEEGSNPILITEVANTPKKNREKMAEILFEHLSAPAMYLANQLVLSLYASGLTGGMCLSSGFSVTQAAAIYEGCLLAHTVQELDIGGQSLTNNLQKLLRDNKGHNFNSSSGWQIVNKMKENMAYVAQDYPRELHQYKTSDTLTRYYMLPDGQSVDISSEMITTAEPLFNPETLLGADDTVASQFPIHKLVNNAFRRCSPELQSVMSRNVVLSGGTTLMRGLVPRLERELSKINPKIRTVSAPDNRRYSAWIGGSILGSLSTIDSMYVTTDEYADYGGRIVNQKCF
ncbi:actin-100-like [Stylophora pistillata]|uniref:actin-100-like n=1 Tax=Stylophora pistillata TaxID=50429 RepID=UPI000C03EBFB|nr:actin-100-like [Stylophora pistillata]